MWVKTGSSAPAGGMTLMSAGKYRLYWTKLGGLSFSVTNGGATTEVVSLLALNDLFWHHVIAASDGEAIFLYIDGMSVGSAQIVSSQGSQLLEGDEDGLMGYWRFNEVLGSEISSEVSPPVGIAAEDMRLGSADGTASSMPMRVASTVPLLNTVELLEDTEAEFILAGVSHDLEDPMVHITFLPAQGGRLYIDETTKLAVGSSFPMSNMVLYKPKDNFNGVETFGYVVNDGTMTSDVQVVKMVVHPQNDVPEAADFTMMVDFKDPSPVELKLKSRDIDNDITYFVVTTLPIHGT
eukprot:scaffold26202_cov46-Prasinocladus_malaysianus.AAC.1